MTNEQIGFIVDLLLYSDKEPYGIKKPLTINTYSIIPDYEPIKIDN